MTLRDLPTVNAALNGAATALLIAGFGFIRRGRIGAHRACMVAAFLVSIAFLGSYVTYHAAHGSTRFPGIGWSRRIYLGLLTTHVTLAAAVPFLAATTLYWGLRGRYERHRSIARVTLPIWLYVSVTGVVIYVWLYHVHGV